MIASCHVPNQKKQLYRAIQGLDFRECLLHSCYSMPGIQLLILTLTPQWQDDYALWLLNRNSAALLVVDVFLYSF